MKLKQFFHYRFIYWRNQIFRAIGLCPHCGQSVNFTTKGRQICPNGCR